MALPFRARRAAPPTRLQVEDWYRRHPEIDDEPINAPLIGLGLPRTGSTALSFLLAEDPSRPARWCCGSRPAVPAAVDRRAPDPRIAEAQAGLAIQEQMNPRLAALVPAEATGPMECQELMALDFRAHYFPAFADLPSYTEWLLDADLTSTYRYERRVPEAPAVGRAGAAAMAAEVPVTPAVARPRRRRLPRCPVRDDPPGPDRCDGVGRRPLLQVGRQFSDGVDPTYLGRLNVEQWSTGMDRLLQFRDASTGRVLLRHRLPRHAARPGRRGARPVRLARRAGERGVRRGHGAVVAHNNAEHATRTSTPRPPSSASTSTRSAPGSRRVHRAHAVDGEEP